MTRLAFALLALFATTLAQGSAAQTTSATLADLERKLAQVLVDGAKYATNEVETEGEQRKWGERLTACSQKREPSDCIASLHRLHIAAIQVKYALVRSYGPFTYACAGDESDWVAATFYDTDPRTATATADGHTEILYHHYTVVGTMYEGNTLMIWEHPRGAWIRRPGRPTRSCPKKPE